MVLNKIDAIGDPSVLNRVLHRYPNAIPVSARSSKGLAALVEAVGEALGREFLDIEVDLDPSDGRLLAFLSAKGEVLSRECNETMTTVHVRMPSAAMGEVQRSALAIRPAGPSAGGHRGLPLDEPTVDQPSLPLSDRSSEVA